MSRNTLAAPDFRRLWSSHSVSLFGDQISILALWIATAGAVTGVLWALPGPLRRMRVLPEMPEEAATPAAPATR